MTQRADYARATARCTWALALALALSVCSCGAAEEAVEHRISPSVELDSNVCPEFGPWLMLPRTVRLGSPAKISVSVDDPDTVDVKLGLSWSATSGTFSEPSVADTAYSCAAPGSQVLTLAAQDTAGCERRLRIDVECSEP